MENIVLERIKIEMGIKITENDDYEKKLREAQYSLEQARTKENEKEKIYQSYLQMQAQKCFNVIQYALDKKLYSKGTDGKLWNKKGVITIDFVEIREKDATFAELLKSAEAYKYGRGSFSESEIIEMRELMHAIAYNVGLKLPQWKIVGYAYNCTNRLFDERLSKILNLEKVEEKVGFLYS